MPGDAFPQRIRAERLGIADAAMLQRARGGGADARPASARKAGRPPYARPTRPRRSMAAAWFITSMTMNGATRSARAASGGQVGGGKAWLLHRISIRPRAELLGAAGVADRPIRPQPLAKL